MAKQAKVLNTGGTVPTVPGATMAALTATVASGHLFVVRHIHVANTTASAATFTLGCVPSGSPTTDTAATHVFDAVSVAANSVFDSYDYLILDPAQTNNILNAKQGTASALTIWVMGDDLFAG